jgi:hypothetical protein
MGRRIVVFALLAAFGLLAAPANASDEQSTGPLGVVYPHTRGGSTTQPSASDAPTVAARSRKNLKYHNGSVLPSSTVHEIFWDPFAQGYPTGYESAIEQYFTDVAADSVIASKQNVYSVLHQYADNNGHHANYAVTDGGPLLDSTAVTSACTPDSGFAHCVTDAQVRAEVVADFPSRGAHDIYFVFLPPGLDTCAGSLGCLGNADFCAYHEGNFTSSGSVLYANEPFASNLTLPGGASCDPDATPVGSDADATINTASHEHAETVTDPFGGGWYTSRGAEVADKCA